MRLFDSEDRSFELHLVATAAAEAVFLALTVWTVVVQGTKFDAALMPAFGLGFGAVLTAGGLSALATGAGRRVQDTGQTTSTTTTTATVVAPAAGAPPL